MTVLKEGNSGWPLYEALCKGLIARIIAADASCTPQTDIALRLEAIIRERDEAVKGISEAVRERDEARDGHSLIGYWRERADKMDAYAEDRAKALREIMAATLGKECRNCGKVYLIAHAALAENPACMVAAKGLDGRCPPGECPTPDECREQSEIRNDTDTIVKKLVAALETIRDSTYRNAVTLRGIAADAIDECEKLARELPST